MRERLPEIEQAAMTRLQGIAAPSPPDPTYVEGLRAAASAALSYLFAGVERGGGSSPRPPAAVLIQSRIAARAQIDLGTVLRRCFAGYALFGDFIAQEAEQAGVGGAQMTDLLREQAALFDRLIAAVTEEHTCEAESRPDSAEERRAGLVVRLLAGEPLDAAELRYRFEGHHLGVVARGMGVIDALRELAGAMDCRFLAIHRPDQTIWAWLGSRHKPNKLDQLQEHARAKRPPGSSLALGESSQGMGGWRLTHRQAAAAWPVALRSAKPVVRYGDVALLAAALRDELLEDSITRLYLEPLERVRHDGEALRQTLRAYFKADHNMSSAASALGVTRQTVTSRLRVIENVLGRQLGECAAELELALRLEEL